MALVSTGRRRWRLAIAGAVTAAAVAGTLTVTDLAFADPLDPQPPAGVTVRVTDDGKAKVTWEAPGSGETAFEVYRDGVWQRDTADPVFVDENTPNVMARYSVRSFSDLGGTIKDFQDFLYSESVNVDFVPRPANARVTGYDQANDNVSIAWGAVGPASPPELRAENLVLDFYIVTRWAYRIDADGSTHFDSSLTSEYLAMEENLTDRSIVTGTHGYEYEYRIVAYSKTKAKSKESLVKVTHKPA